MLYESVFVLHIIGALVTGLVGAYALVLLGNGFADKYKLSAIVLGALAAFEVASGTMLSILSPEVSAISLCSRIFLYLALVALIEVLLFARMKKVLIVFPVSMVLSPVVASLVLFSSVLALGF